MHSFHPSRARILFEIFCAMTIGASFALGWTQTGAPAFLPAAAVCVLYSVVHAFDLNRRVPASPVMAPAVGHGSDVPVEMPAHTEIAPAQADEEEAKALKPKRRSRKKAAAAEAAAEPAAAMVAEAAPVAEPVVEQAPEPEPEPEPMIMEISDAEPAMESPEAIAEASEPAVELPPADEPDEDYHAPIAPLFEPQPLVRQQRAVFGRKAG